MMRKHKVFVAFLTLFIFSFTNACAFLKPLPPSVPRITSIFISSEVLQNMFEIQREYEVETAKCLRGKVENETVYVLDMTPTWVSEASDVHVQFHACNDKEDIGYYHNHPGIAPGWEEVEGPGPYCQFSITDVGTFTRLNKMAVTVVSCNNNSLLWMFRGNYQAFIWSGEPLEPEEK